MKKTLIMASALLLLLGSCSQDELQNENQTSDKNLLMASIENNGSRASVLNNSLIWNSGDQIAILGDGVSNVFSLVEGEGTSSGTFAGNLPTSPVGAAFPYTEINAPALAENTLSMYLPNKITDISVCNLPMWATLDGESISFKHLAGLLAVSVNDIPTGYNQLTLTASNVIAGNFKANINDNEITLVSAEDNTADENKTITASFTATSDNDDSRLFYIPLPVGTYTHIKVTIGNGTEVKELVNWSNKMVLRARIYSTSLTYASVSATTPAEITNAINSLFTESGSNEATAPETPTQIELTGQITADKTPLTIPTATDGETSDITLNFNQAPITDENTPLIIEQNKDAAVGESNNLLSLNMPSDAQIGYMTVTSPKSTVILNGGTIDNGAFTSGTNTLIIGSDAEINNLTIQGGNVRIQNGGKITESITNKTGGKVTIILETGATIENSLPENFAANDNLEVVYAAEYDLRQAISMGGTIILRENVDLINPLEISNATTIDLNGKYIKNNTSDVFVVVNNGELTLNDTNNTGVVWGSEDNSSSSCAVWAKGGKVIINGGTYKVGHDNSSTDANNKRNDCIYAGTNNGTNPGGSIIINGGIFEYTGTETGGDNFLLNLADNDTSKPSIVVKGGLFKNFNPGNNTAEGEDTNFVDKDYESYLTDGTTDVYQVTQKGFAEISDGIYEIRTIKGLYTFASLVETGNNFSGKTIKLTTTLDLKNESWTPIGTSGNYFQGILDGQGFSIKNLNIESNETYVGMFAWIYNATIQNLTIQNGNISTNGSDNYVGILAGRSNNSHIINCHNEESNITLNSDGTYAGGLVGRTNNSVIMACSNSGTITSTKAEIVSMCIGGITGGGFASKTILVGCVNTGTISAEANTATSAFHIGGIVADFGGMASSENYMYGCFYNGSISGGQHVGALCGQLTSTTHLYHSYYDSSLNYVGNYFSINEDNIIINNSSYNEAVNNLNAGIELYNETATTSCNYRYATGDKPALQLK